MAEIPQIREIVANLGRKLVKIGRLTHYYGNLFHWPRATFLLETLMKKLLALSGLMVAMATTSQAASTLFISEVVDGTLPGGLPKYVELTNNSAGTVDLSGFGLGIFNNGNTTVNSFNSLSGMLSAGDSFVISLEGGDSPGSGSFLDTYGFDPDFFNFGVVANGNDAIALYEGPGTSILDVYGVIGTNGTGEPWDYADGYAVRNSDVGMGSATFNLSEWTFSGPNALETGDDTEELALILANTTPGTHRVAPPAPVPLPAGLPLLLAGLGGIAGLRLRKKKA